MSYEKQPVGHTDIDTPMFEKMMQRFGVEANMPDGTEGWATLTTPHGTRYCTWLHAARGVA